MSNSPDEMIGVWTKYSCNISDEERKIFDEALDDLIGVEYEPVAVATQESARNFSFFCNSQQVMPNATWKPALVMIHLEVNGTANLVDIKICEPFNYDK